MSQSQNPGSAFERHFCTILQDPFNCQLLELHVTSTQIPTPTTKSPTVQASSSHRFESKAIQTVSLSRRERWSSWCSESWLYHRLRPIADKWQRWLPLLYNTSRFEKQSKGSLIKPTWPSRCGLTRPIRFRDKRSTSHMWQYGTKRNASMPIEYMICNRWAAKLIPLAFYENKDQ